jgi:L-iditol 2-dehydrogenase
MEWYRIKTAPRVLGHEMTGEIVAVGNQVTNHTVGERVFVSHHIPCNTCRYCLNGQHTVCDTLHKTNFDPGGFAEYIRVPQLNVDRGVFRLPHEVSYEEGVFIEPLACVVRAQRLARLQPGQSVLVLGSGISGLLHIALAQALGAGRILATDLSDYRLQAARRFGADVVIDARALSPDRLLQENGGRLADLVIVATGARAAYEQALNSVDRGGTIMCFAPMEPGVNLSVPINDFWRNGVTMLPSYGGAPLDILQAMELIRAKRLPVDAMITHRLGLAETGVGFQLVAGAGESIKVIVEPQR